MPAVGFELAIPAFKRLHIYTSDGTATSIDSIQNVFLHFP